MKIKAIASMFGFVFLWYATTLFADENNTKINDQKIKKIISTWMTENNIPGLAVEVYAMGEPQSYYFGLADKERKTPVTNKTLFELGSFTELFNNLILTEEVAAGRISLNDSLGKYTPDLSISSDFLPNVSLLHLATHTSSLLFDVGNDVTSRSQLPEYFSNWIPSPSIGSTWSYSDFNFGLLGYVLEASTHENINQLYRNRLLRPLGMGVIGTEVPKEWEENYAQGYTDEDKSIRSSNKNLFPSTDVMKVSGDDMLQFLKASLQLPGVPEKIIDAMRMTQTSYVKTENVSRGLGWAIYPIDDNNIQELMNPKLHTFYGPIKAKLLDKTSRKFNPYVLLDNMGETEGFTSYIVVIPARKSGVVILANRNIPKNEIIKIGRDILFSLR